MLYSNVVWFLSYDNGMLVCCYYYAIQFNIMVIKRHFMTCQIRCVNHLLLFSLNGS